MKHMRIEVVKEISGFKHIVGKTFPAIVIDQVAVIQIDGGPFTLFGDEFKILK